MSLHAAFVRAWLRSWNPGMHKRKGWLNRDHSKDQEKVAAVEAARLEKQTVEAAEAGVSTVGPFCYRYP